jgi:hypothetical protein
MPTVKLTLAFDGPVLSAGVGARRVGIDMEMRRDGYDRHVLAGSHIQGRLREALEELLIAAAEKPEDVELRRARAAAAQIFGREAKGIEANLRSIMHVGDLVLVDSDHKDVDDGASQREGKPDKLQSKFRALVAADYRSPDPHPSISSISTRIAVDGRTGTARRAALAFIEAERPGPRRSYHGIIEIPERPAGPLTAEELVQLLSWCLGWLRHVGKQNTAGWGMIVDRRINGAPPDTRSQLRTLLEKLWKAEGGTIPTADNIPARLPERVGAGQSVIGFVVVAQGPILIADGTPGANVFEGRTDIPGSVIRRALADVLLEAAKRRRGDWIDGHVAADLEGEDRALALHFADVQVSFALPVEAGASHSEPMLPWPLTAWWHSTDANHNQPPTGDMLAALARHDGNLRAAANDILDRHGGVPALISREEARRQKDLPRTLQIHVAKSRRTGAAQGGQLFATRALAPRILVPRPDETQKQESECARFAGVIRCPTAVAEAVKGALARIQRLGKSTGRGYGGARIFGVPVAEDDWRRRLGDWSAGCLPVAGAIDVPIMLVTDALLLDGGVLAVHADLRAPYAAAWREVLFALGLSTSIGVSVPVVVAAHRMWGGATAIGSGAVPPAVMTVAGSTFLIRLEAADRRQIDPVLEQLASAGAERRSLLLGLDKLWGRRAPLGADNGYGQVRIAHEQHLKGLKLREES